MITVTGRLAARAVMVLAGLALAGIGTAAIVTNRFSAAEAVGTWLAIWAGTVPAG